MSHRRHNRYFRRILVGYDGSPQSEKAAHVALSLAECIDATVLLFGVARPPEPATSVEIAMPAVFATTTWSASRRAPTEFRKVLNLKIDATRTGIRQAIEHAIAARRTSSAEFERQMDLFRQYSGELEEIVRDCQVLVARVAVQREGLRP